MAEHQTRGAISRLLEIAFWIFGLPFLAGFLAILITPYFAIIMGLLCFGLIALAVFVRPKSLPIRWLRGLGLAWAGILSFSMFGSANEFANEAAQLAEEDTVVEQPAVEETPPEALVEPEAVVIPIPSNADGTLLGTVTAAAEGRFQLVHLYREDDNTITFYFLAESGLWQTAETMLVSNTEASVRFSFQRLALGLSSFSISIESNGNLTLRSNNRTVFAGEAVENSGPALFERVRGIVESYPDRERSMSAEPPVRSPTGDRQVTPSTSNSIGALGTWRSTDCGLPCRIELVRTSSGSYQMRTWLQGETEPIIWSLGSPTNHRGGRRFNIQTEVGRMMGEYMLIRPDGSMRIYDRQGVTWTTRIVSPIDYSEID